MLTEQIITCDPREAAEREIQRLPWVLTVGQLEALLRSVGDSEVTLAGLPPMRAAAVFRETLGRLVRSGVVNCESLLRVIRDIEPGREPDAAPQLVRRFDRAFFIFGLRRGGNHAIAEWLKGHFGDGETLHLNSAEIGFFETDGAALRVDGADYRSVSLAGGESVLLVGYENLDFLDFPFEHNARVARRSDLVVVLRDYPNMAASIARSARERPSFVYHYRLKDLPPNWAAYARHMRERTGGFEYVKFNDWFSDAEYRRATAGRLGLEFSDRGLNVVSAYGGGSSFDGMTFDGTGQSLNVLERWREMLDDDLFNFLLLAGEENLELNEELFGNFPFSRQDVFARWSRIAGG